MLGGNKLRSEGKVGRGMEEEKKLSKDERIGREWRGMDGGK